MIFRRKSEFEREKEKILEILKEKNREEVISGSDIWNVPKDKAMNINITIAKGFMENKKPLDVLIELIENAENFSEALYSVQQFVAFTTMVVPVIAGAAQFLKRDDKEFG